MDINLNYPLPADVDAAKKTASSNGVKTSVSSLSGTSSKEEMLGAIKEFETYFVEQMLKQMKDSLTKFGEDESKSSVAKQISDLHMDQVYRMLADDLVEDLGKNTTQQLYEQMKRNYQIDTADNRDVGKTGTV